MFAASYRTVESRLHSAASHRFIGTRHRNSNATKGAYPQAVTEACGAWLPKAVTGINFGRKSAIFRKKKSAPASPAAMFFLLTMCRGATVSIMAAA